jgi:hypothetical protein
MSDDYIALSKHEFIEAIAGIIVNIFVSAI